MNTTFARLLAAMLSLAPALPQMAAAQGIDPAARGLAAQARASAAANATRLANLSVFGPAVAGRSFKSTGFVNLSGSTFQRQVTVYKATRQIRLIYQNMVQTGSPQENAVGPYTLHASVIFGYGAAGVSGVSIPVTFGGATSIAIPAYGIAISDPVTVPGFVTFPSTHVVRSLVTMSGANPPVVTHAISGGAFNEGYIAGDLVSSGNVGNSFAGATQGYTFGPHLIIGNASGSTPSLYVAGDSIASATGWGGAKPASSDGWGFAVYFASQNNLPVYNARRRNIGQRAGAKRLWRFDPAAPDVGLCQCGHQRIWHQRYWHQQCNAGHVEDQHADLLGVDGPDGVARLSNPDPATHHLD